MSSGPYAIGEPGRAAAEVGSGWPTRYPDSADHELSECEVPGARIRAASVRGLMHRHRLQPRQDRYSVVYDEPSATLIVTVCDGVGQFHLSQEAAWFVANDAPRAFLAHGEWTPAVTEVNERLQQFVAETARRSHLDTPGEEVRMATTLAAAAIRLDGHPKVSITWTDDSSIWFMHKGEWTNLSPDPSDADEADGLHTGGVKALPRPNPRILVADALVDAEALFVFTDGIGVPLSASQQVRETLASWWAEPPDVFTFAQQAGFARKGHLDDRTAVGVWFDAR